VQQPTATFRPSFGRILTVVIIALMLTAVGGFIFSADISGALHYGPLLAFVSFGTWLLYWHPAVVVEGDRVIVINVGRTWVIPFRRLTGVETQYSLRLVTDSGTVTAWAAPAPGRHQTLSLSLADFRTLRRGKAVENVRPGDAPNTESGSVAFVVRRRWEDARATDDTTHTAAVTRSWQLPLLAVTAALLVASIIGVVTA
jgi:hypothetical protein